MATRKPADDAPPTNTPVEIAGPMPPPGIQADVEVKTKYRTNVDPADLPDSRNGRARSIMADDLDELALSEAANLQPPDPLAEFLETWHQYAGYNMEIIRLADPVTRRMPSSKYARSCFEPERLGGTAFDPVNFVPMLQMVNGNSGGVFRVWLTDHNGAMIPEARLDRFAIADPINSGAGSNSGQPLHGPVPAGYGQPAPSVAPERQPSEMEKQMQSLQTRLLENALERAMNPPAPPPPQAPQLSPQEQLAIAVFTNGDLLGSVIQKATAAVQVPDAATKATWKETLADLAMQNPVIVERVSATLERIVARILPDPRLDVQLPPQPPARPAQQPPQPQAAQPNNMPAEAPTEDDEMDTEDQDMAMLGEIVDYLSGDDEITAEHPIFAELRQAYPARFRFYVGMIAAAPNAETIVEFLSKLGPLYNDALHGSRAQHYLTRIESLRQLCILATKPPVMKTPAPETVTNEPES